MSQPTVNPKNGRQRVRKLARVVAAIDDQVGTDTRFRFGVGEPTDDAPDVPLVELPEWGQNAQWSLIQAKAIKREGKIKTLSVETGRSTHHVQTYRLMDWAAETAHESIQTADSWLPCGHAGLNNLRDGGFSCMFDGCDAEFSREEVDR